MARCRYETPHPSEHKPLSTCAPRSPHADLRGARPSVDEEAYRHLAPREMAMALSQAKAEALDVDDASSSAPIRSPIWTVRCWVSASHPGPSRSSWRDGRSHRLLTGVAVHDSDGASPRRPRRHPGDALLSRARLSAASPMPLDCAGAYKLEQRGIALFERIEADPVTAGNRRHGLPLLTLRALEALRCRPLGRRGAVTSAQPEVLVGALRARATGEGAASLPAQMCHARDSVRSVGLWHGHEH